MSDINNDGHLDLLVSNGSSSNVTVFTGAGDGTFTNSASLQAQINTQGVAAGDFNNDGKQDFAVTNYGIHSVSVFTGNGNGTFQTRIDNEESYSGPDFITTGDFNGDGKLDFLAVGKGNSNNVLAYFAGNGNGTFAVNTNTQLSTNSSPNVVKSGDFNGDGKLDVAIVGMYTNRFDVYLGNGNGTFKSAAAYNTDRTPLDITFGDFNGDGKMDAAYVNRDSWTMIVNFGK
jgi:hypothetical protein